MDSIVASGMCHDPRENGAHCLIIFGRPPYKRSTPSDRQTRTTDEQRVSCDGDEISYAVCLMGMPLTEIRTLSIAFEFNGAGE